MEIADCLRQSKNKTDKELIISYQNTSNNHDKRIKNLIEFFRINETKHYIQLIILLKNHYLLLPNGET